MGDRVLARVLRGDREEFSCTIPSIGYINENPDVAESNSVRTEHYQYMSA